MLTPFPPRPLSPRERGSGGWRPLRGKPRPSPGGRPLVGRPISCHNFMRSYVNHSYPAYEKWLRFGQNRHFTPIFHWRSNSVLWYNSRYRRPVRRAEKVARSGWHPPRAEIRPTFRRIGPMVKLASQQETVEPPVRHGTCRLQITIGGTSYSLRPIPAAARSHRLGASRTRWPPRRRTVLSRLGQSRGRLYLPRPRDQRRHVQARDGPRVIGLIPRSARTGARHRPRNRPAPPAAPPRPSPT